MKKLLLLALFTSIVSCADQDKRLNHLKSLYPGCKIEPATGIIQNEGFEFIVIDSSFQIVAVNFYIGSETKIFRLRNIR